MTLEFLPPFNTIYAPVWWRGESSLAAADFFSVTAGSALPGYNAALPIGASMRGTLTGAGAPPAPLDGGTVFAVNTADPESQGAGLVAADGTYTIPGLAPGSYTVNFQAPSGDSRARE